MKDIDAYQQALEALQSRGAQETSPAFRCGELELQARLFNGEFGTAWQGEDGEQVEIQYFGIWNREPGPDFCGARVLINGEPVIGDIELDPEAGDWEHHGHAQNPAYENVVLHFFLRRPKRRFFTRTARHRAVVQVCLPAVTLRKPPAPAARSGPPLEAEEATRLIETAARFRLFRKHEAARRTILLSGNRQALFQGLATALGYKHNKIPFLLVAERAGWERGRSEEGEALLFGLAGFLDARQFEAVDDEARVYLRGLWETWWRLREREARLILPLESWKFAALRPPNHPHRRMGALAGIARLLPLLETAIGEKNLPAFRERLLALRHPFWQRHFNLGCEVLPRETALMGSDRLTDIVLNVFLPFLAYDDGLRHLANLPGPTASRKVIQAAEWLGVPQKTAYLASAMRQQGLLQLWDDFSHQEPMKVLKYIFKNS